MTPVPVDSRAPRRDPDPLSRFYTRRAVGDVLASLVPAAPGCRLLDLACGDGALSAAAGRAFHPARIVCVDIDPQARPAPVPGARRTIVAADAFDPDLPDRLPGGAFDVVLCNPPYRRAAWDPRLPGLFREAGLDGALDGRREVSADALVAAQCLRLARPGGLVGLVLPDGIVSGRRHMPFRAALLANHRVRDVVQLPPSSFEATEARAHLVVVSKGEGPSGSVTVRALVKGALTEALLVASERAAERMDHSRNAISWTGPSLAQLGARVSRGSLEAPAARALGFDPFHTCDFPLGQARRSHALAGGDAAHPARGLVVAEPDDILVARLDRRLHRKVCGVSSGRAVISAAVLRIRVPGPHRDAVLTALLSPEGEARLAATARGTGARMLGQADLMAMPLPIQGAGPA
jgi:type I restriction enzyme M protein